MTFEVIDIVVLVAFDILELVSSPKALGKIDMVVPDSVSVFSPRANLALSGVAIDWFVIVAEVAVVSAVDLVAILVVMVEDVLVGILEVTRVVDFVGASLVMVDCLSVAILVVARLAEVGVVDPVDIADTILVVKLVVF